jgi:[acyl-carrier-protein] S-malonyltransferase
MNAFIFPGQGAQHAGMGKELADNFPVAKHIFEEANDALGFDLAALCFKGPDEELKLTTVTQPAILTTSIAALKVLEQETGLKVDYAAGHSLGEYSALVCAKAISFADAVRTVRQRGAFMQDAVPVGVGSMAAIIGLDADILEAVCQEAAEGEVVSPANYNSPGQIVIAGHSSAVERAMVLAKEKGAKRALHLPVSAPFHCSLLTPAGEKLNDVLSRIVFSPMSIPVISNVEAEPNDKSERLQQLLVSQVSAPVRWDASVSRMVELGVDNFIEIGPGKVLSGLVKRIEKSSISMNIEDVNSLKRLVERSGEQC